MRAFCLLAAACACARAPGLLRERSAFLEMGSEHYVLVTDLPEEAAREAVRRMEDVRAALWQGSWRGEDVPREPLRVIRLGSLERLREFANPGMSAFYQPSDLFGEPFLILAAEAPGASDVVLKHELAHAQHGAFLSRSPRWFFEGLACYLETLRQDGERGAWVFGEPARDRLEFLREHPEVDPLRVLSASTAEAVVLGGQEGFAFQSASWLIVFYLANERRDGLDDFVHRLARREGAEAAFAAAFPGLQPGTLAEEAARYGRALARGDVAPRVQEIRLASGSPAVQVRALSAADVEAMRAQLFFLSPGLPRSRAHLAQARGAADLALRLDPGHPLALAVQLALPGEGAEPPLDRIREAARRRPEDYRAQMLLALAVGSGRPAERQAALANAARLAPRNATGGRPGSAGSCRGRRTRRSRTVGAASANRRWFCARACCARNRGPARGGFR